MLTLYLPAGVTQWLAATGKLDFLDEELSRPSAARCGRCCLSFLSGGVDLVDCYMMQERSMSKISRRFLLALMTKMTKRFCKGCRRSPRTEHTELYVSGAQAPDIVPKLQKSMTSCWTRLRYRLFWCHRWQDACHGVAFR